MKHRRCLKEDKESSGAFYSRGASGRAKQVSTGEPSPSSAMGKPKGWEQVETKTLEVKTCRQLIWLRAVVKEDAPEWTGHAHSPPAMACAQARARGRGRPC